MGKDKEKSDINNGKLVTVAIHTYDKAHILKSILESEGIPAAIHGIQMIDPVVPGNVRVRINESDLPEALRIIEEVDFTSSEGEKEQKKTKKEILIPVDFSDYSLTACEFGFRLARDLDCKIKLLHAFFTPFYPASVPFGDAFTLQTTDDELSQDIRNRTEKEMQSLVEKIESRIASGSIPHISYKTALIEGLPEEEIITYSKKMRPTAIVMGTRGKNAKEPDLIGSVTAEVMEGCRTPVFAIPEGAKIRSLSEMKTIVFLTNFQEREFKAFDIMMKFLKPYPVKVYLAHIAKKEDVWNEIKLSGVQKRFSDLYPQVRIEYKLIDQSEGLEVTLDKFTDENKIDMVSLSSSHRNIFARIFNPGIARRMIFHSDTPLLVIKGM
ncbi:MAG: universal stress protein [Proteiniphilum sp.]|jgi:nucleotide-binding universal stress UspA family protein|nr:universal stress protein [Proteiniphilum sp.]